MSEYYELYKQYFIWTYVAPTILALLGYIIRSIRLTMKDIKKREGYSDGKISTYYSPNETVGVWVGRCILAFFPVINAIIVVKEFFPISLHKVWVFIVEMLDTPIVPDTQRKKLEREDKYNESIKPRGIK